MSSGIDLFVPVSHADATSAPVVGTEQSALPIHPGGDGSSLLMSGGRRHCGRRGAVFPSCELRRHMGNGQIWLQSPILIKPIVLSCPVDYCIFIEDVRCECHMKVRVQCTHAHSMA